MSELTAEVTHKPDHVPPLVIGGPIMIDTILLAAIMTVLLGILIAMKKGFNEVIRGLESIDQRLNAKSES